MRRAVIFRVVAVMFIANESNRGYGAFGAKITVARYKSFASSRVRIAAQATNSLLTVAVLREEVRNLVLHGVDRLVDARAGPRGGASERPHDREFA
jgi:hypothetical protein